jgi:hypothetical protein
VGAEFGWDQRLDSQTALVHRLALVTHESVQNPLILLAERFFLFHRLHHRFAIVIVRHSLSPWNIHLGVFAADTLQYTHAFPQELRAAR